MCDHSASPNPNERRVHLRDRVVAEAIARRAAGATVRAVARTAGHRATDEPESADVSKGCARITRQASRPTRFASCA